MNDSRQNGTMNGPAGIGAMNNDPGGIEPTSSDPGALGASNASAAPA